MLNFILDGISLGICAFLGLLILSWVIPILIGVGGLAFGKWAKSKLVTQEPPEIPVGWKNLTKEEHQAIGKMIDEMNESYAESKRLYERSKRAGEAYNQRRNN
jgi:hypothetical protein